jgi:protein TonB
MKRTAAVACGFALLASAGTSPPARADIPPPNAANQCGRAGVVQLAPIPETHLIPPYPVLAQRLGEQGVTKLNVLVNRDGAVDEAVVTGTSGSSRLDAAAVSAVKQVWRWHAPPEECRVSGVILPVSVVWNLRSAPDAADISLLIYSDAPDYPASAREQKEEGVGNVVVFLSAKGVVLSARLATSTGFPDLDAQMMKVVANHKFSPGQMDGKPVQSLLNVGIGWVMR